VFSGFFCFILQLNVGHLGNTLIILGNKDLPVDKVLPNSEYTVVILPRGRIS
jgi:hypothetical protein